MIIKNVKIYTMEESNANEYIENGFVKIENGKIVDIGEDFSETTTDEIIDGNGGWLFPGFIDGHTHIGIIEDSLNFEGDDVNEASDPMTPHMRGIDAINPLDRCFTEAVNAGITCVAAGPGSANPIGGQFCAIKTYGKRIDNMIIQSPISIKFAMGENPKSVYHGKNQAPETRMATSAIIRESLYKAKKYSEALEKARDSVKNEDEDEIDEPDFDIKNEALLPVIKGELPAHFHAHRADDIFTAIRIAKEFNIKYTIVHCTEGHLIADELKLENITAFVGPNLCDRSKPELKELSFKNPKIMDEAGIKIGLTTDHPIIPIQYLPLCASLAVKSGMGMYQAFKAITINPAEILGIDNRVGSIKVGKDADMVLFDGNPLDIMTNVKNVIIDGKVVK